MASIIRIALLCFCTLNLALLNHPALADTPLGWINSQNPTAYTTNSGELNLSISGLLVNDSIDFLNYRDDLIAGDQRLVGNSGDLSGQRLELHYGVTDWLSVFYKQQQQDIRINLGEIASVSLIDIDNELQTTSRSAGLRWTLFTSNLLNSNDRPTAFAFELSAFESDSDSFDVMLDELSVDNLTLFFRDPQTFSVDELQDEGWEAKFLASREIIPNTVGSIWLGYKDSESTSGTSSDITSATIASFFEQDFELDEDYFLLGASLNFQISPRLPVLLSYEYIRTNSSTFARLPEEPIAQLPGFLQGGAPVADANHTLFARASYWITPDFNVSLTGNLYSNQFLGVLPHYSNPLSGSFADKPYGYAGIEFNYSLRRLPSLFAR